MEPVTDAAAAADAGDYKRAVKALKGAAYPLYRASDVAGLEHIVREASRLAELAGGRTSKKAEEIVTQANAHLAGLRREAALDAAREELVAHPSPDVAEPLVDVSPMSFGLTLVGAAVMLLAIFLKQFEANTFAVIEKNTLVQNGDGWWFIVLAVIIAGSAWRAFNQSSRTIAPAVCGLIGIGAALFYGLDHSQLRLCSVASGLNCTQARPGIGIYAAGVGGLLALIGGWQIYRSDALEAVDEEDEPDDGDAETPVAVTKPGEGIAERLRTLDNLHAQNLLTQDEYDQRRAAILDQL